MLPQRGQNGGGSGENHLAVHWLQAPYCSRRHIKLLLQESQVDGTGRRVLEDLLILNRTSLRLLALLLLGNPIERKIKCFLHVQELHS